MLPLYENIEDNLEIYTGKASHIPPHLHKSLECVYVTEGTLDLGIGLNMYHMDTQDFAIIFPELIHHYQVFDPVSCKAIYLLSSPFSFRRLFSNTPKIMPYLTSHQSLFCSSRYKICFRQSVEMPITRSIFTCFMAGIHANHSCSFTAALPIY